MKWLGPITVTKAASEAVAVSKALVEIEDWCVYHERRILAEAIELWLVRGCGEVL